MRAILAVKFAIAFPVLCLMGAIAFPMLWVLRAILAVSYTNAFSVFLGYRCDSEALRRNRISSVVV